MGPTNKTKNKNKKPLLEKSPETGQLEEELVGKKRVR